MSIRFKFRSAVNFDTIEIGDRAASISIRELRAKILPGKNSQPPQQGFDLVFSDAVSGLEYKGDDCQIPSGSSVIVKRVPCGLVTVSVSPIEAVKNVGVKNTSALNPPKDPMDEFDDFGTELCPIFKTDMLHISQELNKNCVVANGTEDITGVRLEAQNLEPINLNQVIPKGSNQPWNKKNLEARLEEYKKINKLSTSDFLAMLNANLPSELKCSLCNTFFKEAVMIPCCQHSFCDKCIRQVLLEKGNCPKCFSNQFSAEELLPNLSLRQTIEHFLESQMLDDGFETHDLKEYVPDGESGIEARDTSCALTVVQRELEIPQSSSATGKGSNQIFESYDDHHPKSHLPFADSADSSAKRKRGFWIDTRGGNANLLTLGGHRKGVRNCYICGSPDHLMRDCPGSNPNPLFQPGNEPFHRYMQGYPPYWSSSPLPNFRPFAHMYSDQAMMPFNQSMVSVPPFAMSPYISSMCGPVPGGNMRLGNMGPPTHSELFQLQHCENKRKHSNENLEREQLSDKRYGSPECHRHYSPKKKGYFSQHRDKELSLSHSGDSFARRSSKKGRQDKRLDSDSRYTDERHEKSSHSSFAGKERRWHDVERPNSSAENTPKSSDPYNEGRHRHHYQDPKKYHHNTGHSELSHHSTHVGSKRRAEYDIRDCHKRYHGHTETVFAPSSPTSRRRGNRVEDAGYDFRRSRHISKHTRDERHDAKCKIVDRSEKDHRDKHHYHQRKSVH